MRCPLVKCQSERSPKSVSRQSNTNSTVRVLSRRVKKQSKHHKTCGSHQPKLASNYLRVLLRTNQNKKETQVKQKKFRNCSEGFSQELEPNWKRKNSIHERTNTEIGIFSQSMSKPFPTWRKKTTGNDENWQIKGTRLCRTCEKKVRKPETKAEKRQNINTEEWKMEICNDAGVNPSQTKDASEIFAGWQPWGKLSHRLPHKKGRKADYLMSELEGALGKLERSKDTSLPGKYFFNFHLYGVLPEQRTRTNFLQVEGAKCKKGRQKLNENFVQVLQGELKEGELKIQFKCNFTGVKSGWPGYLPATRNRKKN